LGDGIGCWDFDHCISDGELVRWAREAIEAIPSPLFMEVSQSGEGVHVFVSAPEGAGRKIREGGRHIEFYSAGRYIAVTGNALIL
jgi:primase-polymerase (primpol)-like protein